MLKYCDYERNNRTLKRTKFIPKECFRILAPRGKAVVTTPGHNFLVYNLNLLVVFFLIADKM